MYAIFLYPYARIAGLPAVMGPNNRNPKQKVVLEIFHQKCLILIFYLKNGIIFIEKEMKNVFSREIPQRFSRYKKSKCGKPSGENPKVWYGDSNAAVRM